MSIPQSVRASKAVAHAEQYEGELPAAQLTRLAQTSAAIGHVHARWEAGRDEAGHPQLRAQIRGSLDLVCLSCLKTYAWPLAIEAELRLVSSDQQAADLLQDCEPYQVQDDLLPLREMTEDEMLLALPLMPRCKTCENIEETAPSEPPAEPRGPSPFAALKKLKLPKS
jgi:uncharacterized protein